MSNEININYEIRSDLQKMLENMARVETKLTYIEDLVKDNKKDVEVLEKRIMELEAHRYKTIGVAVAASTIITVLLSAARFMV